MRDLRACALWSRAFSRLGFWTASSPGRRPRGRRFHGPRPRRRRCCSQRPDVDATHPGTSSPLGPASHANGRMPSHRRGSTKSRSRWILRLMDTPYVTLRESQPFTAGEGAATPAQSPGAAKSAETRPAVWPGCAPAAARPFWRGRMPPGHRRPHRSSTPPGEVDRPHW